MEMFVLGGLSGEALIERCTNVFLNIYADFATYL